MPSFAPLRPGDPQRLGGLDLLGRLGEGGQGVVYLATDPAGTQVAVKWLRPDLSGDEVSVERFLREVQVAQQVAPFCTAAVLGTGVEQDRPYIVSEYIEGPSLQRVVQEEGPRAGTVLHRLAIGTATALAAIHQAGIVHRDFKPANVIIGADGARVIDFGIARALNATSTISSMVVGTPAYMPPEQIMGHQVGPAADLFAWASTMIFAASGRAPFGSDTMPAVINRVLNSQPDLGALDGTLREVVAACLAKDPAQRPTAEQVLMRLLQHPVSNTGPSSGMLAQAAAAAAPAPLPPPPPPPHQQHPHGPAYQGPPSMPGQWPPQPPYGQLPTHPGSYHPQQPGRPRKSRAPLVAGITIACALLLLAGVIVVVSMDRSGRVTADPPATTPSAGRTTPQRTTPSPSPTLGPVPEEGPRKQLPGGAIGLFETPGDAIVLTSYEIYDKANDDWIDYARGPERGAFTKYAANWESLVSPGGRYLATRGRSYSSDDYDFVVIADRRTGDRKTVKTVKEPMVSTMRAWSKDGTKILLNVEKKTGDKTWVYLGVVIIDAVQGEAKTIMIDDPAVRTTPYGWDGAEQGVVNVYDMAGKTGAGEEPKNVGLRFFGADGKKTHDAPGVGTLSAGTQDIFSISGEQFVTDCPNGGDGDHCLWDSATGKRVRKFSSDCDKVLGWYDDAHLYCWEQDAPSKDEVQVIDLKGNQVRRLLEVPKSMDFSPVFTVNRPS
uniref:serine/threonine protein kinase n=1 Tax=Nonomuraea pusilla TaxID=46177 RepID=UPI0006E1A30A|nr:serine/threonine-protein kinase [Nonomuraea pusilla]